MPADHSSILAAGADRIDEAELPNATGQRLKFLVGDTARIKGIGLQPVKRNMFDRQLCFVVALARQCP